MSQNQLAQRAAALLSSQATSLPQLPVTIGLGRATALDGVEIAWPSGTKQKIMPLIDRLTVVIEPRY